MALIVGGLALAVFLPPAGKAPPPNVEIPQHSGDDRLGAKLQADKPKLASTAEAETPPRTEGSPPPIDISKADRTTIHIFGRVVDEDGRPIKMLVESISDRAGGLSTATVMSSESGEFECSMSVLPDCREIVVVGKGSTELAPKVTYPERRAVPTHSDSVNVLLVARDGALIEDTIDSKDKEKATILVTQIAVGDPEPYYGWNSAGFRPLDRLVTPDSSGRFSAIVRPGLFRLHAFAAGALGMGLSGSASPGQRIDVGDLDMPRNPVDKVIRVLDQTGAPISGAWVQLSDRELSVVSNREISDLPHFRTDHQGEVRLPPASRRLFPMTAAVGAPGYASLELQILATPEVEVARLAPSPRIKVHLVGSGAASLDGSAIRRLKVVLSEQDESITQGVPTPLELIDELVRRNTGVMTPASTPRVFSIPSPPPGKYSASLWLDDCPLAACEFRVRLGETEDLEFPILGGRVFKLEVILPDYVNGAIAKKFLRIQALHSPDEGPSVDIQAPVKIDGATARVSIWLAEDSRAVKLSSRNSCLLPLLPLMVGVSEVEGKAIHMGADPDAGLVHVTILGRVESQPESGTWPVFVMPQSSAECPTEIIAFETGEDGSAQLLLREGTYEVRTDRSLIRPYAFTRARVVRGSKSEAALSIMR